MDLDKRCFTFGEELCERKAGVNTVVPKRAVYFEKYCGTISKKLSALQASLGITDIIGSTQEAVLFGSAHGLRELQCL